MARKPFGLSARGKRTRKSATRMPKRKMHSSIDYSDIPPSTDEELKSARRVGRPSTGSAKQLIAIRISPSLLLLLRDLADKQDKPYQTLIHELLEKAVKKAA